MRVLMVNKFLYPNGGSEKYIMELGRCLSEQGHQVEYFGMEAPGNTVGNQWGIAVSHKDFHSGGLQKLCYPFSILYSLEARRKMRRIIESFHPHVVHLNNINFQLTPSVIDAAIELHVPIVQTVHDYQLVCPNHLMLEPDTLQTCDACVNRGTGSCIRKKCVHGSTVHSLLGAAEGELYRHKKTYQRVALYICPSRFMQDTLQRDARFAGKTRVIRNFTQIPAEGTIPKKKDYVLYFGRLSREKGIDRFLEACSRLPEIPFVVAGNGPLEEECRGKNLPNVTFVGFQSGAELHRLIGEALLSVHLPVWQENCPLSVMESISLGTPVLASRMGGIPELVQEGETGVLLEKTDGESCAREIKKLYDDRKRLGAMAEACLVYRKEFPSLEEYAETIVEWYQEIQK